MVNLLWQDHTIKWFEFGVRNHSNLRRNLMDTHTLYEHSVWLIWYFFILICKFRFDVVPFLLILWKLFQDHLITLSNFGMLRMVSVWWHSLDTRQLQHKFIGSPPLLVNQISFHLHGTKQFDFGIHKLENVWKHLRVIRIGYEWELVILSFLIHFDQGLVLFHFSQWKRNYFWICW